MRSRFFWIFFCALITGLASTAQIRVSRIDINKWVKDNFAGQGVVIGNIKVHGNPLSMGAFNSSNNAIEIQKGLILSTGTASSVAGLNNKSNQSYSFGDAEKDPDLQKYIKPNLYDVSMIEFDFVPLANKLQFRYQFGSEEYPEYVGSTYNDVFGFFVSDDSSKTNIALIPGKNVPVSINTVNHLTNAQYFIDNNVFLNTNRREAPVAQEEPSRSVFGSIWNGFKSIFGRGKADSPEENAIRNNPALYKKTRTSVYRYLQFDGITRKMAASTYVVPYQKYHMKIIIADVADNIFDSGVFIEDRSLTVTQDTSHTSFADYSGLSKFADPAKLIAGKKLQNILPDTLFIPNATIYFKSDRADVEPSEMKKLANVAALYDRIKDGYVIRVAGHTDSIGNFQYNMNLSRKRNESVMNVLQELRDIEVPIEITEDAFLKPVATNETEEGRMKNRRVEVFFVKRD